MATIDQFVNAVIHEMNAKGEATVKFSCTPRYESGGYKITRTYSCNETTTTETTGLVDKEDTKDEVMAEDAISNIRHYVTQKWPKIVTNTSGETVTISKDYAGFCQAARPYCNPTATLSHNSGIKRQLLKQYFPIFAEQTKHDDDTTLGVKFIKIFETAQKKVA